MYQDTKSYVYDCHKPKSVPSDDITTSFSVKSGKVKSNDDPGTSYEVFRNNTTAIEVIVKEIGMPKKYTALGDEGKTRSIPGNVNTIKKDSANAYLIGERTQYQAVIRELRKQLDTASKREMDAQTKNLHLLIEIEKLKGLLNSKTNLVDKLKKELTNMKCLIKFVIKSICQLPQRVPLESVTLCSTDAEYEDFESELQKDVKNKFAVNMFEVPTFDSSSASKETKLS